MNPFAIANPFSSPALFQTNSAILLPVLSFDVLWNIVFKPKRSTAVSKQEKN